MEIVIYMIPFITALFLLFVFNKKMVWWEYAVLIVPSLLFAFLTQVIMVNINASDIEYLGGYINRITYYEPWDEMVLRTKTRTVPNGKGGTRVQTYTVLERDYHREKYTYVTNDGDWEHSLSKKEYETIKQRMGNNSVFRDMNRKYHKIDGDAYDIYWDKTPEHLYDITHENIYKNKVKAMQTNTIFKYGNIDKTDAKELGLYEYPSIQFMNQNPIIGREVTDKDVQKIKYINAIYGKQYQFRMFILLFESKDFEISEMQRTYWQNGNKNEFIVCLGTQQDSVIWCNPFSWCDSPKLEVLTRDYFIENPKLDIEKYGEFIEKQIPTQWVRKEFEDFSYIKVGLSKGQYIALVILMIIINIGISIFLVKNEISNENNLDNWN